MVSSNCQLGATLCHVGESLSEELSCSGWPVGMSAGKYLDCIVNVGRSGLIVGSILA